MDFRLVRMIMRSKQISPENKIAFLERIVKKAPIRQSIKLELARGMEMQIEVSIHKRPEPELPKPGSVEIPYCS